MAIDANTFGSRTFGNRNGNSNGSSREDRPKAQYWLNIGYSAEVTLEDGSKAMEFVSLQSGIALDTMETLPTNQKNEVFAQLMASRNDLRDQLVAEASALKPGETKILPGFICGVLQMQLRRVEAARAGATIVGNPFRVKLDTSAEAA
jgi:hypothetical protein